MMSNQHPWLNMKDAPRTGKPILVCILGCHVPVVAMFYMGRWVVVWDHTVLDGANEPYQWIALP